MPCVENLQIVHYVLIYLTIAANETFFFVIVTVTWGIFFVV